MSTGCLIYPTPSAARTAAERLLAHGTPPGNVTLLVGFRGHDVRHERTGGFAGPVGPDAPVGTFSSATHPRSRACGAWVGDADLRRQGTFADAEQDTVLSFAAGRRVAHSASHRALAESLSAVTPDPRRVEQLGHALHDGRALLLVAGVQNTIVETPDERVPTLAAA